MVLLELTEKEAEIVHNSLLDELSSIKKAGLEDSSEYRSCYNVLIRLDVASKGQPDVLITDKDLFLIISNAKTNYTSMSSNTYLSNKKVEECDFKHIALANAVTMWLNGKDLLKRLVRFDYTDHSCQYEELE